MKLQKDLNRFTNGKDNKLMEHWLAKIKGKIKADANLMDTLNYCIAYVMNCMNGITFSYLEPRAQDNAARL